MVRIYCRAHHATRNELCEKCHSFVLYARKRLDKCPFQQEKPTCGNCSVHCYNSDMQQFARTIMRYSGPRMTIRHPILAIRHLLDGQRPVSRHPRKQSEER